MKNVNYFLMNTNTYYKSKWLAVLCLLLPFSVFAQAESTASPSAPAGIGEMIILLGLLILVMVAAIFLAIKTKELMLLARRKMKGENTCKLEEYMNSFDSTQIDTYLKYKQAIKPKSNGNNPVLLLLLIVGQRFLVPVYLHKRRANSLLLCLVKVVSLSRSF